MLWRLSKRSLAKCEKYIYMLVSNVSVVYFRFETWIKRWQSINTFVSINVVLLVGFSPSVGRSQLWDNSCHNSGSYAGTAKLRQLCWLLRQLCWGSYAETIVLEQLRWSSYDSVSVNVGLFDGSFPSTGVKGVIMQGFLTKRQLRLDCRWGSYAGPATATLALVY